MTEFTQFRLPLAPIYANAFKCDRCNQLIRRNTGSGVMYHCNSTAACDTTHPHDAWFAYGRDV
jgi:hypothetical protein